MAEDQREQFDDAGKAAEAMAAACETAESMTTEGKSAEEIQKTLERKGYGSCVAKHITEHFV